jgi:ketosteroid isomerase-like protein
VSAGNPPGSASRHRRTDLSERSDRLTEAFAALDRGDLGSFRDLFEEGARWLGVPGSGFEGATPI